MMVVTLKQDSSMSLLGADTEPGAEVEGPAYSFSSDKDPSLYNRDADLVPQNGRCTYAGMLFSDTRPYPLRTRQPFFS